jgi:acyl-homoserine lactone acylase PvdQ
MGKCLKGCCFLLSLPVILFLGLAALFRFGFDIYNKDMVLESAYGTARVYRDDYAIPHVFADNEKMMLYS